MSRSDVSPAMKPATSITGAPSPRGTPSPRRTASRRRAACSAATRDSPQIGMRSDAREAMTRIIPGHGPVQLTAVLRNPVLAVLRGAVAPRFAGFAGLLGARPRCDRRPGLGAAPLVEGLARPARARSRGRGAVEPPPPPAGGGGGGGGAARTAAVDDRAIRALVGLPRDGALLVQAG